MSHFLDDIVRLNTTLDQAREGAEIVGETLAKKRFRRVQTKNKKGGRQITYNDGTAQNGRNPVGKNILANRSIQTDLHKHTYCH